MNNKNTIIVLVITVYIILNISIYIILGYIGYLGYKYIQTKHEQIQVEEEENQQMIINDTIKQLEDKYNIKIIIGESSEYEDVKGTTPTNYELYRLLNILNEELGKYPSSIIRASGLRVIHIINNIKVNDIEYEGGYAGYNKTIALAYYSEDMYGNYMRDTIHHEIFHLLVEGRTTYLAKFIEINDSNPKCRKYLYVNGRDKEAQDPAYLSTGCYINTYGINNPYEDMATIAQNLFDPDNYKNLIRRINEEQDKDNKETLIKKYNLILYIYNQLSYGYMDKQYWQLIHSN